MILPFLAPDLIFPSGAYAEYIAASSRMLMHKPKSMTWEEAAGIPETWITATQALYLVGGFTSGKSVLWHAGASSVSIAGVQLSIAGGASAVYVTSRTQDKIDWCVKELGATGGFNTSNDNDWAKELLEASNGSGVDVLIDFMGASTFQQNLNAAAVDGHIVNLGFLGGVKLPAGVDISAFVRKRIIYEGSSLRSRSPEYQGRLRDKLEKYLPNFENRTFKIFLEKTFNWEDIQDAHRLMESNKTKGKIICIIN
jgi:NADPH:quinone reductase-like Zn-dependent oxidoreductase